MSDDKAIIRRNRFFGVVIIAIIFIPMALAYVMFHTGLGVSSSTTNKGTLLNPPVALQELPLVDNSKTLQALFDEDASKRWRLLVPVTAACGETCQQNLYTTRQVHVRLAQKAYRVERILVAVEELPPQLEQDLQKNHPNVVRVKTTKPQLIAWLGAKVPASRVTGEYYLVDQEGFAMMRYSVENTGQELLDDIKKLLKFTYEQY